MTVRVGINGFGRIGRNFFRAVAGVGRGHRDRGGQRPHRHRDPGAPAQVRQHPGPLPEEVKATADEIKVGGKTIKVLAERDPAALPWRRPGRRRRHRVDRLLHQGRQGASTSTPGAKKVIISAPANDDDITIVMGVNDDLYDRPRRRSSPTRPAPRTAWRRWPRSLHDAFGIERGLMTTIHAYTHDQNLQDGPHKDLRRARAAALNIVPTSTGAAKAIGLVLPELKGKLDGFAMRVPVPTGSATDLTVHASREASADEINARGQGRRRGPAQGHPHLHRRPDRLLRHRHRPVVLHLRRRADQGHRQPGQGRRLVRQRVGLLQPPRRPVRLVGAIALRCGPSTTCSPRASPVGACSCAPT